MLKLIVPPTEEPVTLEEAKAHLRVDVSDDDNLIDALITAARQYCEVFQGRAYALQTFELHMDGFPSKSEIKLPRPPLLSVDSIKYYGTDDTEYEFEDFFVDTDSEPGRVVLNYGASWPAITLRPANGVCVTFTVGYDEYEGSIPQSFKQAMLLIIGDWYENREAKATIPKAAEALLWPDRCF